MGKKRRGCKQPKVALIVIPAAVFVLVVSITLGMLLGMTYRAGYKKFHGLTLRFGRGPKLDVSTFRLHGAKANGRIF